MLRVVWVLRVLRVLRLPLMVWRLLVRLVAPLATTFPPSVLLVRPAVRRRLVRRLPHLPVLVSPLRVLLRLLRGGGLLGRIHLLLLPLHGGLLLRLRLRLLLRLDALRHGHPRLCGHVSLSFALALSVNCAGCGHAEGEGGGGENLWPRRCVLGARG